MISEHHLVLPQPPKGTPHKLHHQSNPKMVVMATQRDVPFMPS